MHGSPFTNRSSPQPLRTHFCLYVLCALMCRGVHPCSCGWRKPSGDLFYHCPIALSQGVSVTLELGLLPASCSRWCVCVPHSTSVSKHAVTLSFSHGCLGSELRSSCLSRKHFCLLSSPFRRGCAFRWNMASAYNLQRISKHCMLQLGTWLTFYMEGCCLAVPMKVSSPVSVLWIECWLLG